MVRLPTSLTSTHTFFFFTVLASLAKEIKPSSGNSLCYFTTTHVLLFAYFGIYRFTTGPDFFVLILID